MGQKEYEVISHNQIQYLNVFLVRLSHRTPHIHSDFELGWVLSGELTVKAEQSKSANLKAGDIFLINPMEMHEFAASNNSSLILTIQFSPHIMELVTTNVNNLFFEHEMCIGDYFADSQKSYDSLHAACLELAFLYFSHRPGYEFKCLSLVALIFSILQTNLPWEIQTEKKIQALQSRTKRMYDVIHFIDQNFQRKLLLNELAEKEHLSLTYLSHFIKDNFGMTFQKYVNSRRLEYACELLENTDRSILDISIESGFSDVRYLNQMFQALYGCTPKEFRNGLRTSGKTKSDFPETRQFIFPPRDSLSLISQYRTKIGKQIGLEKAFLYFYE